MTLLDSRAEPVIYDIPAITTAGRFWVRGRAGTPAGVVPFEFFVKHVQSWSRSPFFESVPEEIREMAEASVPWRTEHLLYRSGVAQHLPECLSMPRALGVFDLDEKAASIWLEVIPTQDAEWDLARFSRAAYLLGRLAANPAVRPFADVGGHEWDVKDYLYGRLHNQVLPVLRSDDLQERDDACVAAYVQGLRDEGDSVPEADVRRAHALQFLIFTGLSTLPMECLEETPTPELVRMSEERAAIARFSLDLVDATR